MKIKIQKIFVSLIILVIFLLNFSFVFSSYEEPTLVSEAAFLMDNKTKKILYDKNSEKKMYPASTTKIVTAILTLENCKLDDMVTVNYDAIMAVPKGYSTANLQIGEQLTIEQLLQLLLIPSANDAANVLAEHVGGSIDSFVSMMNTKVNELGLHNTHFTNTYGKHDENHYTTARDLAYIFKYCIKNENFRKISGMASCAIASTNKYGPRKYTSTNQLVDPSNKNYYQFLTAGKTGFTTQAGDCLVSCSYQNNLELICVILGGKTTNGTSTRFSETKTLYEYAYNNYLLKQIADTNTAIHKIEISNATSETKNLDLLPEKSIDALITTEQENESFEPELNLQEKISAPIEQGTILGKAKYKINGIEYEVNLIASHSVEKSKLLNIIFQLLVLMLIVFLIYKLLFHKKRKTGKVKKIYTNI